jgi:hypothetical protein
MQLSQITEDLALILPIALLVEAVVAIVGWFAFGSKGGRGARIAAWLALVTLTFWCGSAVAFVLLNVTYFALGSTATMILGALITVVMVLMPFGWAAVVRHHGRSEAGAESRNDIASQPR